MPSQGSLQGEEKAEEGSWRENVGRTQISTAGFKEGRCGSEPGTARGKFKEMVSILQF